MFAIIRTSGHQFRVKPDDHIVVDHLETTVGATVTFDDVLLVQTGKETIVGQPNVKGASVTAEVLSLGKADKVTVQKFHSKTRYRKKVGHRQHIVKLKITAVNGPK
jgi:large subunit ribosomal protein L21